MVVRRFGGKDSQDTDLFWQGTQLFECITKTGI